MANQAPPVQGYMLQVAATRLTPEKFALLKYKLATGSPIAMKIMDCIKPGEWEAVVGDSREFNDIRWRLEAAIDAWIAGNPQSKGFFWPPQAIKLNLADAAAKLSKLTTDSTSQVSIIRAGAENKIQVYWFNDLKTSTYISDFTGDLSSTYSDGPQQLSHTSLRELSVAESITAMDFQLTDKDFALLEKIKGKAVDDDGNLLGYRHPATKDGTVTVSRDQLFVFESDLRVYAATLTPVGAPKDSTQWGGETPPHSSAGVTVHTTKFKKKDHHLLPSIEEAQKGLSDKYNATAVWANLQGLANKKFSNLLGATEEGVQYLSEGITKYFKKAALTEYLKRQHKKDFPHS